MTAAIPVRTFSVLMPVTVLAALSLLGPTLRAQPEQKVQDAIVADALADKSAYEFLGRLCDDFGGRLTGSTQNRGALDRLAAELKALGLTARIDPFKMPGWERGDDEVTMLAPITRRLRVAALSYTQPHPVFEAEVVDIGQGREEDFAKLDAKGKIGLLAANTAVPRGEYEGAAVKRGMLGILFIDREGGGQLLARTGAFTGVPLRIPIYSITQEEGLWMGRLLARGQPVRVKMLTRSHCREIETANLVVTFPGRTPEKVMVGAHFDSWDLGQGAMDNGLGTAQLFALAKLLQTHAAHSLRTVELIWFNGEEQGLWGSRRAAVQSRGEPIAAMINLDMVGYPLSVNALGCDDLLPVLERFDTSLGARKLKQGVANVNWFGSDHTPYQLEGVRSVTLGAHIDREVNRYYHDLADTFDKSDAKMIADSSATIAALTYRLANEPGLGAPRHTAAETRALFTKFGLVPRLRGVGMWPFAEEK